MNNKITENIQKEKKWMNTKKVYNLVIKTHTKKCNKQLENEIIRDIRVIFESEKKDYYKPIRIKNFHSNNYIEYESIGDKSKTLI